MSNWHGWKNLRPYRTRLLALAALSAVEVALRITLPWPMKIVVDDAIAAAPAPSWLVAIAGRSRESWLLFAVVGGILLQIAHQAVLLAHTRIHAITGYQLTRDLRQRLFIHFQALGLRHHSRMPVGDSVYRLQSDAAFLDQLLVRGALPLIFSGATLIVMFSVLASIDVQLALTAVAIVPILYAWIRLYGRRLGPTAEMTHASEARLTARLQESFSAIRLVKSFAREPYESTRFAGAAGDAMEARVRLTRSEGWFSLIIGNLIVLGTSLVLYVGGRAVISGRITLGTLLLALAYLGFVYGPLSGIAGATGTIHQALASARRVREVFRLATEVDDGKLVATLTGRIELQHVTFSYDGAPVLRDINVTINPGELVAIVGPSGSGKTTLVSLIPRFYDPTAGHILLDGTDSRQLRLRRLREQVAIVQQEVIVLSGSVRENLRYGRLDASTPEIEDAARAAHAHDFVTRLPQGYDTELAEAGAGLSGGEKQRLSIARAFLKDAPILILDEPTAALDTVSERLIFDAIERLRRGRTTLVIAHRLSTVRAADRILLLDRGQLIAQGTHESLLATSDLYRQLAATLTSAS